MDIDFWVGYQESVGIAKALAAKNSYEIDSNQEVSTLCGAPISSWEELLRSLENDFLIINQLSMFYGARCHPPSTHKAYPFPKCLLPTDYEEVGNPLNAFPPWKLRFKGLWRVVSFLILDQWAKRIYTYIYDMCEMRMRQWPKFLKALS